MNLTPYIEVWPYLLKGLGWTLFITVVGLLFGFLIGAGVGLWRLSPRRFLRYPSTVYVEVIRGTPILAQVLFIYFALPDLLHINLHKVNAAIIAIALNAGAYIAEIVRGAIQSIEKGQREAGLSVGLKPGQTMRYVIWPQAVQRMLPPLGNQFIISLKDTSLFSVIAVGEILFHAKQYYNTTFHTFEALTMACVLYLMITIPASVYLRRLERRTQA